MNTFFSPCTWVVGSGVKFTTCGILSDLDFGGLEVFSWETQPILYVMIFCKRPRYTRASYNLHNNNDLLMGCERDLPPKHWTHSCLSENVLTSDFISINSHPHQSSFLSFNNVRWEVTLKCLIFYFLIRFYLFLGNFK